MIKDILFGGKGCSDKLGDFGLALLRVSAGIIMAVAHGLPKLQDPSKIIDGTTAMGFPLPTISGWLAIMAEFLGGILLALGLLTRPAAFFVAFTMGVAAFVAHGSDPFAKKEMALLYLVIMIMFLFTGAGRFSIDRLISK